MVTATLKRRAVYAVRADGTERRKPRIYLFACIIGSSLARV